VQRSGGEGRGEGRGRDENGKSEEIRGKEKNKIIRS
jgi:hypothetical protein